MTGQIDDDELLPLSALNDLLFCERRAALHRTEQVWVENRFTLEGTGGHRRAHGEARTEEWTASGRVVRGMWLRSARLGLIGVADIVEFRANPAGGPETPYPVEFKRGNRQRWDNDDVQVCAQALCIEEMLGVPVPAGAIFHIKSKRRREVSFDADLRQLTIQTADRLRNLVASGHTPPPVIRARCRGCSLLELCLPHAVANQPRARRYLSALYVPGADT